VVAKRLPEQSGFEYVEFEEVTGPATAAVERTRYLDVVLVASPSQQAVGRGRFSSAYSDCRSNSARPVVAAALEDSAASIGSRTPGASVRL